MNVAVALAVVLPMVLGGCTGAPDRSSEANRLEKALAAMPGVDSASVSYENSFARGSTLHIQVRLPTASAKQIANVATTINDITGDDFEKYEQSTDFVAAQDWRVVIKRAAHLDPGEIGSDAQKARDIAKSLDGSSVEWFRNSSAPANSLDVKAPNSSVADGLGVLRKALGDTVVNVSLATKGPDWSVRFPFSVSDEAHVTQVISAMPVDAFTVSAGDHGAIVRLYVTVRDRVRAYEDLSTTIELAGGSPAQPLYLYWTVKENPRSPALGFQGSVTVGGCNYTNTLGEQEPEKYYTSDAIALQKRIRERFDTCPR